MRLIDADSLIDLVTDSTILGDGFKTAFCALVNGEPTVKMQKTGKWDLRTDEKYDVDYYVCSNCGYEPYRKMEISNYCPNCGARMEREGDE